MTCYCYVTCGLQVAFKLPPPKAPLLVVGTGCLLTVRLVGATGTSTADVMVALDMHVCAAAAEYDLCCQIQSEGP